MLFSRTRLALAALALILSGSAVMLSQVRGQKPRGREGAVADAAAPLDRNNRTNDELDVAMLERAWIDAVERRDDAVVNRILADDFAGIDSVANVVTKVAYLRAIREEGFTALPIEIDQIRTRIFGETVVVTMRLKTPNTPTWGRMTHVYVKREGRWQCVASHSSSGTGGTLDLVSAPAAGQVAVPVAGRTTNSGSALSQRLVRVRPRFECLVEKVRVRVGQSVKKGDPLIDLFSTDLAAAKNDFQVRKVQWENALRTLKLREQLRSQNAISVQLLVDTQNDENRARLEYETARGKLGLLGLDAAAIERTAKQQGDEKARLTWRSPVDGTIVEVGAEPGNLYDKNDVLAIISASSADGAAWP